MGSMKGNTMLNTVYNVSLPAAYILYSLSKVNIIKTAKTMSISERKNPNGKQVKNNPIGSTYST